MLARPEKGSEAGVFRRRAGVRSWGGDEGMLRTSALTSQMPTFIFFFFFFLLTWPGHTRGYTRPPVTSASICTISRSVSRISASIISSGAAACSGKNSG